ncbi:MAG TPA: sensor histidine kinase [Anaerolineae bacterium]|nr:sensor histidine kinase [Anaerolineae bacterium]
MGELNYLIIGLVVGWLVLGLGGVVFHQVRRWWRRRQYGAPIDRSLLLMEYGRKLTSAKDMDTMVQILTEELPRKLQVERAELLLPDSHQLVPAGSGEVSLPINHSVVRLVASAGDAQRGDRNRLKELIRQGRTDLSWIKTWVPLMRGAGLRGMWLLGQRAENSSFAPEDLRWLTAIAREAAAVLEAIRFAEQERFAASEMRELYRQMVKTRELERGRISRELHDGVLQDLSAVTRDLKALETQASVQGATFSDLADLSGETIRVLRAICNDLRPPLLQQDLGSALKTMVVEMDNRSPAPIHIEITAQTEDLSLPDEAALAIFRITQEAVNNAIQHADASEIAVRLTVYPDRLRLTVTDDGRGISGIVDSARFVTQGHYGLAGMRERATMIGGKLDVQTAVDYGTVVIFELSR